MVLPDALHSIRSLLSGELPDFHVRLLTLVLTTRFSISKEDL